MNDLWIFAYGSLMWRPDFPHQEVRPARLHGWHRSLCVYSWHHRGTEARPGVVLGLDRGGSCRGLVYRVAARDREQVLATLRERELVTAADHLPGPIYREVIRPVHLGDAPAGTPGTRPALTYVVDRRHPQYTGPLDDGARVDLVRHAHGISGPNPDYVRSTVVQLRLLGIRDHPLERILARLDGDATG